MRLRTKTTWRGTFRRHLAALLFLKFAALALLWALFFSPAHRFPVDGSAVARRLMPAHAQAPAGTASAPPDAPKEGTHD